MRRSEFAMAPAQALQFLRQQTLAHLASTTPEGTPVLRTVHTVVVDDWLCFHAAPAGEKTAVVGRGVVLGAEELVATVPSTFFDPQRACPATTYYRSVQVHGRLEAIETPEQKARVLQSLMEALQPQGGHLPVDADHPLYRAAVAGLLIAGVKLDVPTRIVGKAKLAQNLKPLARAQLLESLWRRGEPSDPRAIERLREANPDTPTPDFLAGPEGARLCCHCEPETGPGGWLEGALALLGGEYWNDRFSPGELAAAHRGATAWVGARDERGRVIATARAIADGGKGAWLYDVCVAPDWRGRGLGQAVVRLLLDHPAVRGTRFQFLGTRDAQELYGRFGFVDRRRLSPRPYATTEMVRERP